MSESQIKVTDKRIFTPDGQLREEYRHMDEASPSAPAAAPPPVEARPVAAPPPAAPGPAARTQEDRRPPVEIPLEGAGHQGPGFLDLVAMLAEPVPIYLGDAELPDGSNHEDLEMARLHLDLLDVLHQKTAGNLTRQESALLEDLLYRFRMRYVQKRG